MKTRTVAAALIAAAASLNLASPTLAQSYQNRCQPNPSPWPYPGQPEPPVASSFFLGVYTSTVPVSGNNSGPVAYGGQNSVRIAPGYGETVYGQAVDRVVPNSPAYHAGLEPGDIIVSANGRSMDSKQDLIAAIQGSQGYLEMQVVDSRSGQLQWVVAQPESQGGTPVFTSQRQGPNPNFVPTPRQNSGNSFGSNRRQNSLPSAQQLTDQVRSLAEQFGGRRAPVRRNR